MEQEYEAVNQIIQIMKDKENYLEKLQAAIEIQMNCFDETFDQSGYERVENRKDEYIQKINQLNDRFDTIAPAAVPQIQKLIQEKNPLAEQLQKELSQLEVISAEIEEAKGKLKEELKKYFNGERKLIKGKRMQRKIAATYYKNMTRQTEMMSYFYDKSK